MKPVIAITAGEPAGIGPEISLRAAWALRTQIRPVVLGDARMLADLAGAIDPDLKLRLVTDDPFPSAAPDGIIDVMDCPLSIPSVAGLLDQRNGNAMLRMLDSAIDGARQQRFDAIVTAPLQKSTINEAGIPFTGHTEYLAEKTQAPHVVMMLAGDVHSEGRAFPLRVALATTHLPLRDVAVAVTRESLAATLDVIDRDLKRWFGISRPRILVCGLNPHAGEGGHLGREEIDVITPAIDAARQRGIDASGPYPADTLFQPKFLESADCVLAMYHDQGLPVLKHASFGRGVNITLGLPIIRTSVDHGTALDQAQKGVGHASYDSMVEAILQAARMVAASSKAA